MADIRSDPAVYTPFKPVPEVQPWLDAFKQKALRYPVMVVHGVSRTGCAHEGLARGAHGECVEGARKVHWWWMWCHG